MPGRLHGPLLTVLVEAVKSASVSGTRPSFSFGPTPDPLSDAAFRALSDIVAADPDLSLRRVGALDQIELGGPDEHRLSALFDTYASGGHPPLAIGAPQIGYREAILRLIDKDFTFRRSTGLQTGFARVRLVCEPDPAGYAFRSQLVGNALPDRFVAAVAAGVDGVARSGCLAGFPVVDTKVRLVDGAYHDRDSSIAAFEIAASSAFREALGDGGGLLEPVMRVVVTGPEDYWGAIEGDLRSRRGWVESREMRGDTMAVVGLAPLANMFGYVNELRGFSQGRSTHVMTFDHYRPVPPRPGPPPDAVAVAVRW